MYNGCVKTHVIVKTHELALKGKNRPWFMRKLNENLRRATEGSGVDRVWQGQLMIGLTLEDENCWEQVKERVRDCFGVAKFFLAYEFPQDLDQIRDMIRQRLPDMNFRTFRMETNRADKALPHDFTAGERGTGALRGRDHGREGRSLGPRSDDLPGHPVTGHTAVLR